MKKILLIAFLSFIISCTSQKSIEYHFTKGNAQSKLIENIKNYENIGYDIFFILGKEDGYNIVDIVPIRDKNKKVQGIKLNQTNRKLILNNKPYFVFFDYDYELGATKRKATKEEENDVGESNLYIITKQNNIYDYATTLYFDKNWNFVKKSSLIKFK